MKMFKIQRAIKVKIKMKWFIYFSEFIGFFVCVGLLNLYEKSVHISFLLLYYVFFLLIYILLCLPSPLNKNMKLYQSYFVFLNRIIQKVRDYAYEKRRKTNI